MGGKEDFVSDGAENSAYEEEEVERREAAVGSDEDSLHLYLRQMGDVPLLLPEEEPQLFRQIEESWENCRVLFKETLKNKCFKAIALPPHNLVYCAA